MRVVRNAMLAVLSAIGLTLLADDPDMTGRGERILQLKALDDFRQLGMETPAKAIKNYLTVGAETDWKIRVSGGLSDALLSDFFTGAVVLPGPAEKGQGVGALFNPWWDGLLLVRLDLNGKTAAGREGIAIRELNFLSGETFRGEKTTEEISTKTVVPEKDPLSVEVWRVTSATVRRFETLFPDGAKVSYGKFALTLAGLDLSKEMERLQVRAGLRLRLTQIFLGDKSAVGKAAVFTGLIRNGNHFQLFSCFRDKDCFGLLRTLSEMPEMFRRDFTPYGYIATTEGAQHLFVNRRIPRLYALAAIPKDVKAKPASLEWYDLEQSGKLLEAWNANGKGVAK